MTEEDFKQLVGPVNMLIGYCQSASELTTKGCDLERWKTRLMELGDQLRKAWDETALKQPGDQTP